MFVLGLKTIYPISLIILLGIYFKKQGLLSNDTENELLHITYNYVLPLKILSDLLTNKSNIDVSSQFLYVAILGVLGTFLFSWGFAVTTRVPLKSRSAFVQTAFRSNYVYMGYPILEMLFGHTKIASLLVVNVLIVPLFNALSICVLEYYKIEQEESRNTLLIIKKILRNPLVLAAILGVIIKCVGFNLPEGLISSSAMLGKMASPLALLLIGSSLVNITVKKINLTALKAVIIRVVLSPLIIIFITRLLHPSLSYEEMMVIFILFATPCATNAYIMTKAVGGDAELASTGTLYSFIASIFTMPLLFSLIHIS